MRYRGFPGRGEWTDLTSRCRRKEYIYVNRRRVAGGQDRQGKGGGPRGFYGKKRRLPFVWAKNRCHKEGGLLHLGGKGGENMVGKDSLHRK